MRDAAGRISRRVESIGGATITWDYAYDSLGRLVEVKKDGVVVESYGYDLNGNGVSEVNTLRGVDRSSTYSDEDHVIMAGDDLYQFDVDGFLVSRSDTEGITGFAYSSRGELLEVVLPDGTLVTYEHDPLGRRIAKYIDGQIIEKYLWADMTTLLAVYDGNDSLISRFEYADSRLPVSMASGGGEYFLMYDQVGSLRVVTDTSGTTVKQVDYDSFGNVIGDSNSTFSVPFGFAGGLYDTDTGLARFGFRDYDPALGRWTAKDPIDFAGGDWNLYGYVQSDPVNKTDLQGLHDLALGAEIDAVISAGFAVFFGIVIDFDDLLDSGLLFIGECAPLNSGGNIGYGIGGQYYLREAEGYSAGLDVNAGVVSGSAAWDSQGLNSIGLSFGPGFGFSTTEQMAWSLTPRRAWNWIKSKFE